MNIGVILAAGSGSRMGAVLPKQFLKIDGVPILVHSVKHFFSCAAIDKVILAVSQEYLAYTESLLADYFPGNDFSVIAGGKNRSETLCKMVNYIFHTFDVDEQTILVTHDGVRPFIDERMILENISAARECGACNTVVPAVDTILSSKDGVLIDEVLDRRKIYHAQTPQSFNAMALKELLDSMSAEQLGSLTDGCSVFVLRNKPVKLVMGSHDNIKITYPSDLK